MLAKKHTKKASKPGKQVTKVEKKAPEPKRLSQRTYNLCEINSIPTTNKQDRAADAALK